MSADFCDIIFYCSHIQISNIKDKKHINYIYLYITYKDGDENDLLQFQLEKSF